MGVEIEARTFHVTREDLVRYAEASGDHNPIHQDEAVALSVGLPGVIAHGMYSLALVGRYVDEWVGHRGEITGIGAKFVKPVVVPLEGADLELSGVHDEDARKVTVTAVCDGLTVLRGCVVTLA